MTENQTLNFSILGSVAQTVVLRKALWFCQYGCI